MGRDRLQQPRYQGGRGWCERADAQPDRPPARPARQLLDAEQLGGMGKVERGHAGHDQWCVCGCRLKGRPGPFGQREGAQRVTGTPELCGHAQEIEPSGGPAMRLQVEQHRIGGRGQAARTLQLGRPGVRIRRRLGAARTWVCTRTGCRPADQVRTASDSQRRRISSARPACAGPATGLRSAAVRTLTADSGAGSPAVPLRRSVPSGARVSRRAGAVSRSPAMLFGPAVAQRGQIVPGPNPPAQGRRSPPPTPHPAPRPGQCSHARTAARPTASGAAASRRPRPPSPGRAPAPAPATRSARRRWRGARQQMTGVAGRDDDGKRHRRFGHIASPTPGQPGRGGWRRGSWRARRGRTCPIRPSSTSWPVERNRSVSSQRKSTAGPAASAGELGIPLRTLPVLLALGLDLRAIDEVGHELEMHQDPALLGHGHREQRVRAAGVVEAVLPADQRHLVKQTPSSLRSNRNRETSPPTTSRKGKSANRGGYSRRDRSTGTTATGCRRRHRWPGSGRFGVHVDHDREQGLHGAAVQMGGQRLEAQPLRMRVGQHLVDIHGEAPGPAPVAVEQMVEPALPPPTGRRNWWSGTMRVGSASR